MEYLRFLGTFIVVATICTCVLFGLSYVLVMVERHVYIPFFGDNALPAIMTFITMCTIMGTFAYFLVGDKFPKD